MKRIYQLLIAIDQVANTVLGLFIGDSWADETLSARAWRCRNKSLKWSVARAVIDGLFFLVPNHCKQSYQSERLRLQSPPEERALT